MTGEQLREQSLALDERRAAQIPAVEMDEIEGVEDELVAGAFRQRVLQQGEAADPLVIEHDDLAVDDRFAAGQLGEGVRKIAVALGPVEPGARDQPHFAVFHMRHGAIAVELDFVQPRLFRMFAVGRVRHLRGELRLDAARGIGPFRALNRAGLQARGFRRGLRLLDQFLYPAARFHALGAHG